MVWASVLTTGMGGLFLLMLTDYLFHMPGWLRLVLLLADITGLGTLIWRRLMLPLTTRLTDQFLASRVENMNKQLADELMSAVNFIHNGAAATNAFAARHIDLAEKKTAGIRFEDAIDYRQASKSVGSAFLVAAIIGVIAMASPLWPILPSTAGSRLHPWPGRTPRMLRLSGPRPMASRRG